MASKYPEWGRLPKSLDGVHYAILLLAIVHLVTGIVLFQSASSDYDQGYNSWQLFGYGCSAAILTMLAVFNYMYYTWKHNIKPAITLIISCIWFVIWALHGGAILKCELIDTDDTYSGICPGNLPEFSVLIVREITAWALCVLFGVSIVITGIMQHRRNRQYVSTSYYHDSYYS